MVSPLVLIVFVRTQSSYDFPIIRKWTDVYTAGSTSGRTENILMFNGEIQRAMSAHTQPCNASRTCFPTNRIISFDVGHQFFTDKRLVLKFRFARHIPIPAAV